MNVSRQDAGRDVELKESSTHSVAWKNWPVNSVETDENVIISCLCSSSLSTIGGPTLLPSSLRADLPAAGPLCRHRLRHPDGLLAGHWQHADRADWRLLLPGGTFSTQLPVQ